MHGPEHEQMKAAVLEMLEFPKALIRGSVEWDACPHAGHYAGGDARCTECDDRLVCEWLCRSDESSVLEHKTLEKVVEALLFAIVYVDVRVTRAGHEPLTCRCAACSWLRDGQKMFDEIGIHP